MTGHLPTDVDALHQQILRMRGELLEMREAASRRMDDEAAETLREAWRALGEVRDVLKSLTMRGVSNAG